MKKIILFFLFCFFLTKNFAQIRVKNSVHLPVFFSYGYFQNGDKKSFFTKGWWKIIPNETITINVPISFQNPIFFYSFISDNEKFRTKSTTKGESNYTLLVDPQNSFSIFNAHMQYVKDRNPNYVWRYFKQRVLSVDEVLDKSFIIHITYDDL